MPSESSVASSVMLVGVEIEVLHEDFFDGVDGGHGRSFPEANSLIIKVSP